jgi:hypothetical protein
MKVSHFYDICCNNRDMSYIIYLSFRGQYYEK